jgi:hypothetical protein
VTVLADIFQVGTHKTEGLVLRPVFYLVDTLDGFLVENIAAQTVHGVGRITDHPAFFQDIDHLRDQPWLGVKGIYFQ